MVCSHGSHSRQWSHPSMPRNQPSFDPNSKFPKATLPAPAPVLLLPPRTTAIITFLSREVPTWTHSSRSITCQQRERISFSSRTVIHSMHQEGKAAIRPLPFSCCPRRRILPIKPVMDVMHVGKVGVGLLEGLEMMKLARPFVRSSPLTMSTLHSSKLHLHLHLNRYQHRFQPEEGMYSWKRNRVWYRLS